MDMLPVSVETLRGGDMKARLTRLLCSGTALTVLVAVLGAPKKW
jgi:hypothetical protein